MRIARDIGSLNGLGALSGALAVWVRSRQLSRRRSLWRRRLSRDGFGFVFMNVGDALAVSLATAPTGAEFPGMCMSGLG